MSEINVPTQRFEPYIHRTTVPEDFVPAPEPESAKQAGIVAVTPVKTGYTAMEKASSAAIKREMGQALNNNESYKRHTVDGATVWMFSMFGAFVLLPMTVMGATMISNANSAGAIAGKLPALAQADGFTSAKPVNLDLTSASRIVLQATDTCTISSVEVVTVDQQGNQNWGGNAVDITQYSITNSPKGAPATTDTFHNFAEFDSSGLKEKYCS